MNNGSTINPELPPHRSGDLNNQAKPIVKGSKMRPRDEIIDEAKNATYQGDTDYLAELTVEVLLDIRDLLQ